MSTMIQCPKCKQMLPPGVRFCPHDGTPLTETAVAHVPTPIANNVSRSIPLPVTVGERYQLVEFRGGGGMAKVYRSIDTRLNREVAVKLINPELRVEPEFDKRFEREAKMVGQLADPHIVAVHDFGLDAQWGPFLVMEYLQGQSLRERLALEGVLPWKAGLQLGGQLLLALLHAHSKGIVHRDIKPDNIFLVNQSGIRLHVRVLDFGIARIYRDDENAPRTDQLTQPGAVPGTPRYMSPEQLAGRPIDVRSDIYSAALVIHEALTKELPYVRGKLTELCPDATVAMQELLDQCLKPNPAERPPSAVEVYLRLQELGKASGILLLPPGAMDRLIAARQAESSLPTIAYDPNKAKKGRKWWKILAGLAVAAAAAVGAWALWGQ